MSQGITFYNGGLGEFTPAFGSGTPNLVVAQGSSGTLDLTATGQPNLKYPLKNVIDELTGTANNCPGLAEQIKYQMSTDNFFMEFTPTSPAMWMAGDNPGDVVTWTPSSNIYPLGDLFNHKLMVEVKIDTIVN